MVKWLRRNVLPIRYPDQALSEATDLLETPQMLAETIKTWPDKWLQEGKEQGLAEGLAEGRVEGLAEGRQASIIDICRTRGLELSAEQRRRIERTLDPDQLKDWLLKAMQADSADQIFS